LSAIDGADPIPRVRLTGAQRRREIIAAAQSVFATNGLGGARTSQIAEAAGVAESMLYKHFDSKQELFEAAVIKPVAEFVQSVVDGADGLLDRDGPGSERFYRSFLATMTEVLPLLGVALFSDSEEGRRFYNASIVPLYDRYEDKVRRSLETVAGTAVRAPFLAQAVIGMMFILALDTTFRDGSTAPRHDRDRIADEVRLFVAASLSGSAVDDLLDLLTDIESRTSAEVPPAPALVTTAAWSRFWSARQELVGDSRRQVLDLAAENQTLRRIVADQAIEIRGLRDHLAPGGNDPAQPEQS
jgi:TetR/AcrR family transcriptional regulator